MEIHQQQENCWPVSKERMRPITVVRPTIQPQENKQQWSIRSTASSVSSPLIYLMSFVGTVGPISARLRSNLLLRSQLSSQPCRCRLHRQRLYSAAVCRYDGFGMNPVPCGVTSGSAWACGDGFGCCCWIILLIIILEVKIAGATPSTDWTTPIWITMGVISILSLCVASLCVGCFLRL